MRAVVDQDLCIGCGMCAGICPDVFEMGDTEKAQVVADTNDEDREAVKEAIDSCPAGAISEGN